MSLFLVCFSDDEGAEIMRLLLNIWNQIHTSYFLGITFFVTMSMIIALILKDPEVTQY